MSNRKTSPKAGQSTHLEDSDFPIKILLVGGGVLLTDYIERDGGGFKLGQVRSKGNPFDSDTFWISDSKILQLSGQGVPQ